VVFWGGKQASNPNKADQRTDSFQKPFTGGRTPRKGVAKDLINGAEKEEKSITTGELMSRPEKGKGNGLQVWRLPAKRPSPFRGGTYTARQEKSLCKEGKKLGPSAISPERKKKFASKIMSGEYAVEKEEERPLGKGKATLKGVRQSQKKNGECGKNAALYIW